MNQPRDPYAPTFRNHPVDYLLDHPTLVLAILACAIVSSFGTYQVYQKYQRGVVQAAADVEHANIQAKLAQRQQLQADWPLLPMPPLASPGVAPVLPPLPAVIMTGPNSVDVSPRLTYLIANNPDHEVAVAMQQAGASGAIMFQFADLQGTPAELDGGSPPVMRLDPSQLAGISTTHDVLLFMLVVNHEWVHFKQHEVAKDPDYLATFDQGNHALTPRQCEFLYHDELEAYTKECTLALSWGISDYLDNFCRYEPDPAALAQQFFLHSLHDAGTQSRVSECIPTWARLAGHPHPEAYQ